MERGYSRRSIFPSERGTYDVAQICRNGHLINASAADSPEYSSKFCKNCGCAAISACSECSYPIPGRLRDVIQLGFDVPAFCCECGKPYPWTEERFDAIKELIEMAPGLSPEEKQLLKDCLPDIASNTPRSEVAAIKFKKLIPKAKDFGKKLLDKVVMDLATDQTKVFFMAAKDWIF